MSNPGTENNADTTAETGSGVADTDTVAPADSGTDRSRRRGRTLSPAWRIGIALGVLLAVSTGLTSWLYFGQYRADQQVGLDAEQAASTAAADGAVAVLSYAPDTLDADFGVAKSHLTGDFLSYYTDFTQKVVAPAAKQKDVRTSAAVVRKGIMSISPDSAKVLIFINQNTVSKTNPDGSFSMSSVEVGLEKHDGHWLISSFDPV